jgi:hypothetical protein
MAPRAPRLRGLVVGDSGSGWAAAGFAVGAPGDAANVVRAGPLTIVLADSASKLVKQRGVTGWMWSDLGSGTGDVGGVRTARVEGTARAPAPPAHANGVVGVDHVVLRTGDLDATKRNLASFGLELLRERADVYPGITQAFYRPGGEVTIELVGPSPGAEGNESFLGKLEGPPVLWGITFTCAELGKATALLGDKVSAPRKAVQKGREICTLRHDKLGVSINVAFMTPHVKDSKL